MEVFNPSNPWSLPGVRTDLTQQGDHDTVTEFYVSTFFSSSSPSVLIIQIKGREVFWPHLPGLAILQTALPVALSGSLLNFRALQQAAVRCARNKTVFAGSPNDVRCSVPRRWVSCQTRSSCIPVCQIHLRSSYQPTLANACSHGAVDRDGGSHPTLLPPRFAYN
jgi:hypothetical protein